MTEGVFLREVPPKKSQCEPAPAAREGHAPCRAHVTGCGGSGTTDRRYAPSRLLTRRLPRFDERGRGTTRSVVEGVTGLDQRRRQSHEAVGDGVDSAQHIDCGDARHGHALGLKPSVPARVALRPVFHLVAHPVDFDRKARLGAIKVEHIGPDRMLTPEGRHAGLTRAQPAPQHRLRRRQFAAKLAGAGDGLRRRSQRFRPRFPHHHASRGPPSPRRGGGKLRCSIRLHR